MNFASVKPEGQPSQKHTEHKYSFYCRDCEQQWESDPQAIKDYDEYVWLRDRTSVPVHDMKNDGSYTEPPYIDSSELSKRIELAKKISSSYRHMLDLNPSEWYKIEQDSKI